MDIMRVTARWTGFQGSPGYSAFHFGVGALDGGLLTPIAEQVAERVGNALTPLGTVLPEGVTVRVEQEIEVLESETGTVIGFEEIEPSGGALGQGSGGYSAASGAVVNWRTNDVRFGRRIRGRTFLVPLAGDAYEDDGSLTTDARTTISSFATRLVGSELDSDFGVWSRPRNGSGGVFATVVSHNVPDMSAVLRSRRD